MIERLGGAREGRDRIGREAGDPLQPRDPGIPGSCTGPGRGDCRPRDTESDATRCDADAMGRSGGGRRAAARAEAHTVKTRERKYSESLSSLQDTRKPTLKLILKTFSHFPYKFHFLHLPSRSLAALFPFFPRSIPPAPCTAPRPPPDILSHLVKCSFLLNSLLTQQLKTAKCNITAITGELMFSTIFLITPSLSCLSQPYLSDFFRFSKGLFYPGRICQRGTLDASLGARTPWFFPFPPSYINFLIFSRPWYFHLILIRL